MILKGNRVGVTKKAIYGHGTSFWCCIPWPINTNRKCLFYIRKITGHYQFRHKATLSGAVARRFSNRKLFEPIDNLTSFILRLILFVHQLYILSDLYEANPSSITKSTKETL